ncbi:CooT family nickel-binding protein [Adlercreutzia sp. ZJ242]|uniref:CooT family nickel-binding protein n=1 Tax=Adlercreutzia sp. ZJ242 TaxID=2709409 RepID=UPI0013EB45F1|nr:CooT family nickel-binding protein [Adlercreutzia sp. ZJ242]
MCLASVYVEKGSPAARELVMDKTQSIECADGRLVCRSLFGERVEVEGFVRLIDFSNSLVLVSAEA